MSNKQTICLTTELVQGRKKFTPEQLLMLELVASALRCASKCWCPRFPYSGTYQVKQKSWHHEDLSDRDFDRKWFESPQTKAAVVNLQMACDMLGISVDTVQKTYYRGKELSTKVENNPTESNYNELKKFLDNLSIPIY